jgi:deoxyribodipyrimidine photo-lyase
MIILFHFKQFDLRTALSYLRAQYGRDVLPVGLITRESTGNPRELDDSFLGIARMSPHRRRFYRSCIDELGEQYKQEGLTLLTSDLPTRDVVRENMDSPCHIWVHTSPGSEETSFLDHLAETLPSHAELRLLPATTMLAEDELPMSIDKIPATFSGFRKRVEKRGYEQYRFTREQFNFPRAHSRGRERLDYYLWQSHRILTYKQTRNGLGAGDYASRLSKWLAVGAISGAEVAAAIRRFETEVAANESTYWLLFELLWRDYFHYLHRKIGDLLFFPRGMKELRSPGLRDTARWKLPRLATTIEMHPMDRQTLTRYWQRFLDWAGGTTTQPLINAIMCELFATGEISNRARLCAASALIYDLGVPWWWGAQWFEYCLLDYDVSSNWGNWAYAAGVGADSRPERRFNIEHQTRQHDPDGVYRNWVAAQGWENPELPLPPDPPI